MKSSLKLRHSLMLVITAMIWGGAFVAQSTGGDVLGPFSFSFARNLLGCLVLIPVIFLMKKTGVSKRTPKNRQEQKTLLTGGISCGVVLCIASNFQQVGINAGTPAGKAGFLTACYILIVPILGLFLRKKCSWNIWIGVILTVMGLYLLCINGSFSLQLSDLLVMICAFMYAIHILVIDHFSPLVDGVRMSCIQFLVCGLLSGIPMLIFELIPQGFSSWCLMFVGWNAWIPILYTGILSCGVAFTFQIIGQEGLNSAVASLLMSMESVFSVLAGWLILKEYLTNRELCGCLLIFCAVILAQIPFSAIRKKKA